HADRLGVGDHPLHEPFVDDEVLAAGCLQLAEGGPSALRRLGRGLAGCRACGLRTPALLEGEGEESEVEDETKSDGHGWDEGYLGERERATEDYRQVCQPL